MQTILAANQPEPEQPAQRPAEAAPPVNARRDYARPVVTTFTDAQLLDALGPAQASLSYASG